MKHHIGKPLVVLLSIISVSEATEAKFSTEKSPLVFGQNSISFLNEKEKVFAISDKQKSITNAVKKDEMVYYPNTLVSLKLLLKSVGTLNTKSPTSIASDGNSIAGNESLKEENKQVVLIENLNATCLKTKQYLLAWQSTALNATSNSIKITYTDKNNKVVELYHADIATGVKLNQSVFVTLPEAMNQPTFNIAVVSPNKTESIVASIKEQSDEDGEMVALQNSNNESALFVKTIGAGVGNDYKLELYDEKGNLIVSSNDAEILAGSSQIIPVDIPQTEHGTYTAVLSSSGSKKKKKVFKITH
jgi:hypothetical protein